MKCPECEQGKEPNCTGMALHPETDELVVCETVDIEAEQATRWLEADRPGERRHGSDQPTEETTSDGN